MKVGISTALKTHYAGKTTSVQTCWKCTLTNGTVLGFTSHDQDIVFDGLTYRAGTGLIPANTESQTRMAVDNTQAAGVLDSDVITADDIVAGLWDFAKIEIFQLNWRDTTMGADILMSGRFGEVRVEQNSFQAELRGGAAPYQHTVGQIYQPTCRATLGDARCGVDLDGSSSSSDETPYRATGTLDAVSATGLVLTDAERTEPGPAGGVAITGITRATLPVVTAPGHGLQADTICYIAGVVGMTEVNGLFFVIATVPNANTFTLRGVDSSAYTAYSSGGTVTAQGDAGWWDYGLITMTSGASAGLSMEVKAYSPGTITLQVQFALGVAAGDEYEIVVGCGKRFVEDCVGRFDNGINFRGEPHLIGIDQLLRVGGT